MPTDIGALESLFGALADRTRLRILGLLAGGEVCVCDIHETLKIPQPKASRHLAYLRRAGLVEARKQGLWVHYRLAPASDRVAQMIVEAVEHGLGHLPAIARDRARLEKKTGCCAPRQDGAPERFACCTSPASGPLGSPKHEERRRLASGPWPPASGLRPQTPDG